MMKKNDLRVKRTNKMIIEAFLRLLETKSMERITIQEIADEAMINRATFYAHFKDKQDLYEHLFHIAIQTFTSILDLEPLMEDNKLKLKRVNRALTQIYQLVAENKAIFITTLDGTSIEFFRKKLKIFLSEKYATIFDRLKITENELEVPIDFITEYITAIFTGTLHWWVTSVTEMTPQQLATLVIKLVGNGHLTVLGIEIEK